MNTSTEHDLETIPIRVPRELKLRAQRALLGHQSLQKLLAPLVVAALEAAGSGDAETIARSSASGEKRPARTKRPRKGAASPAPVDPASAPEVPTDGASTAGEGEASPAPVTQGHA